MNTGGPAFPGTLLDWMAGQLAAAYIGHNGVSGNQDGIAREAYDIASALVAEKARREATGKQDLQVPDHSGDANKMAEDHFRGVTEMTKLEAQNRELLEALRLLVCEAEMVQSKGYAFAQLDRGVVMARAALGKAKEAKP